MASEYSELPRFNNSSIIDILNQQSFQTTCELDEDKKPSCKRIQSSELNGEEELSTLFNTTGRERNSTGPLKQWLFEHQHHPYPNENDKDELMKKTKMSALQITVWFTNARVKMRKENKLTLKIDRKKTKQEEYSKTLSIASEDEIFELHDKHIVMAYSCLNNEQIIELRRLATIYPNQVSLTDCVNDHTTHLIIGNEENSLLCPLTTKLFQSIARHLYIISYKWIIECLKQNVIIDVTDFEIRGDIPFGQYHDGMKNSRLAKQNQLFQNCRFFILCNGCQDKMSKIELASLIQLCHGTLLDTFPLTTPSDNSLLTIILCDKLLPFDSLHQHVLFVSSRSNGVHFLNPEWVLESIVHFALQPFDSYEENFS